MSIFNAYAVGPYLIYHTSLVCICSLFASNEGLTKDIYQEFIFIYLYFQLIIQTHVSNNNC